MMNSSPQIPHGSYEKLQKEIDRQVADIEAVNAAEEASEQQRNIAENQQKKPWWKRLFSKKAQEK